MARTLFYRGTFDAFWLRFLGTPDTLNAHNESIEQQKKKKKDGM
jgi:hypothetical protein